MHVTLISEELHLDLNETVTIERLDKSTINSVKLLCKSDNIDVDLNLCWFTGEREIKCSKVRVLLLEIDGKCKGLKTEFAPM